MSRRLDDGNPQLNAALIAAAVYLVFCFLVQAAAATVVRWSCHAAEPWTFSPAAGIGLFAGRMHWITNAPASCHVGTASVWMIIGPALAGVLVLTVAGYFAWRAWRQSGSWLRKDILSREGVARRAEIVRDFGSRAVVRRGKYTRPGLTKPRVEQVSWTVGKSRGVTVHVSTEESMVIQGAPRSGKGLYLIINAILDAPGAVVTTSTRADNLVVTMKARASGGRPVTVFDPQGMSGLPTTLRWSPVRGCVDPDIATRRALVITADTEFKGENAAWQKRAVIVLQCLLHAAALSGDGVRGFRRWASNPVLAKEALEILGRPEAALGWQADLMGIIDDDPRNTSNSWIGVSAAVAPLSSPTVLSALDPRGEAEQFDPKDFIRQRGTLYLIGTKSGAAAAGPYLSALIDDIDHAAREMAFVAPGGRLDPPLSLILDEIANLSPWPGLPVVLSDGGGIGISTIVVLQSLSQARSGWSIDEAATIWDAAIIKVIFGGGSDERDLRALSGLIGERSTTVNTRSWSSQGSQHGEQVRETAVIPLHEIRRLPAGTAIMLGRRTRPILLDLREWHKRKDAVQLGLSKAETERELADGHRRRQEVVMRTETTD
ncbi:type IV secretory pathway TraG/TraD family ATPase VirD4 [Arthrobacter silviterrae]|uniref:TraM recognition domain-containing protein n=1 Tax=Arthrobacter silviterrae TaxID=2026658 RepID=A0ABX0DCR8_9MICC|nr:type IV secretory system conjugative DNA transfer family protein [Arthrobacter silviterrae]MDQ0276445.1 type IV secretory pathway TraG/TraD family ATPase VirD4 [Arthrobacter silviterrae]NGN84717.1 TraM recognition domain-containing protein [Arthrobacter silviterrae]